MALKQKNLVAWSKEPGAYVSHGLMHSIKDMGHVYYVAYIV